MSHMPDPHSTTTPKPWVAYVRVSTEEQAGQGASLDQQESKCRDYLKLKGYALHAVLRDPGASAKDLKRPGIRQLRELVDAGEIGGVVIWKLDRITRSVRDLFELVKLFEDHQVLFVSMSEEITTTNALGRFMLTLLGALAEFERGLVSERTKAIIRYKQEQGEWTGGCLLAGLRPVGPEGKRRLEVDPSSGPIVSGIWSLIVEGSTLADVASYLNKEGVPRPGARGKSKWHKAAVSSLVKSKQAIGLLVNQRIYDQAMATLETRFSPKRQQASRRLNSISRSNRIWPLHGKVKCGLCGSSMANITAGRGGLPYFRCIRGTKKACGAKDLPAEEWENAIISAVQQALQDEKALGGILADIAAKEKEKRGPLADRREAHIKRRDGIAQRLKRLVKLIEEAADELVTKGLLGQVRSLQGEIDDLDAEITTVTAEIDTMSLGGADPETLRKRISEGIRRLSGTRDALLVQGVLKGLLDEARISSDPPLIELTLRLPTDETPRQGAGGAGSILSKTWLPGEDSNLRPID